MKGIDYKQKYQALKARFVQAVQQSFQMGYEKGFNEGSMDQQMQQLQAQQEAEALAAQQGQEGEEGGPFEEGGDPSQQESDQPPQGAPGQQDADAGLDPQMQAADDAGLQAGMSELEAGLQELESLISKSEGNIDKQDLAALLTALRPSVRRLTEYKTSTTLRKSLAGGMKHLKRANKAVRKHSKGFQANVTENGKKSLSMQEKIVADLMKSWEKEESQAINEILNTAKTEGHVE
jgi:hypothetical protein